jgi:hypothetical protein
MNRVQAKALEDLHEIEEKVQQAKEEGVYLKLALVAGDPRTWLTVLFPHLFEVPREDVSDLLDDEGMINAPNVTLKFKETPDPTTAEEILADLLGQRSGVMTANGPFSTGGGKFWEREG